MAELLQKEDIEHLERWETPAMKTEEEVQQEWEQNQLPTVADIEAIEQQAYDEGFARGFDDGNATSIQEMSARGARLDGLLEQLSRPFEQLDDIVESQLCQLTFAIAKQVVRRELKTSPEEVVGAVREALGVLPVASRNVRLQLHPDDAVLVREALASTDGQASWQIVEDPLLMRGGCRVLSETSRVDATIEKQLGAAIAAILGDERTDREDDDDANTREAPPDDAG